MVKAMAVRRWLFGSLFLVAAICGSGKMAAGDTIVADSIHDWDLSASNNGGVVQQGHPDTLGTGQWFYSLVNATHDGQTELTWNSGTSQFDSSGTSPPLIGETAMQAPSGGSVVNRIWQTPLPVGTTLRVQGEVTDGTEDGNGALFAVVQNQIPTPVFAITPVGGAGSSTVNFDFLVTIVADPHTPATSTSPALSSLNFVIASPNGGASDLVNFDVTISEVPEPAAWVAMAACGAMGLVVWSFRRRDR